MQLTRSEILLIRSLVAREEAINRDILGPLAQDRLYVFGAIAARLGLGETALGTTHHIDLPSGTVVPIPAAPQMGPD